MKQALIIEVAKDSVKAGVFSANKVEYVSEPLHPADGLKDSVQNTIVSLKERVNISFDNVYVSLDPAFMILRVVEMPFDDRKKINEVLPFELSELIATDIGEAVLDNIPLGHGKVLAIALEKKFLRECLDALKEIGIDPVWIGSASFSLPYMVNELCEVSGVTAFVSNDFISVSSDGKPLFFNSFKGKEGLKLSLLYLGAEGIQIERVYFCVTDNKVLKTVVPGFPADDLTLPDGLPPEAAPMLSLAFQIKRNLLGDTVNFRKGEFEYTRDKTLFRNKLKFTAAGLMIILALLIGDFYLRYLSMESEFTAYNDTLRGEYVKLFPAEKTSYDEVYQLQAKLKAINKESEIVKGGFSVLDTMKAIAATASVLPDAKIKLNELSIENGRIKASGDAGSFEAANRFKDALSRDGLFKEVILSDVNAKPGGGALFNISLKLKV